MPRPLLIPVLAALLAGCVFDTAGLSAADGPPRPDGPAVLDASLTLERWARDVPMDGPAADHPQGDGPSGDGPSGDVALLADTTSWPDTAPWPDITPWPDMTPPTCDDLFKSSTPGYSLCQETATTCRFYFSGGASCNSLCGAQGCVKTEDNASGSKCQLENNMDCGGKPCTCSSTLGDGICTCNR